jgi:transcriptional regulator with XRE-family HTH domain
MTLFSSKIEELIMESGESVQSLAEIGKISRSTLQRVKSGERLPPKNFFSKLCKALRLSPAEIDELKLLLEIQTVGERHYYNRQTIIELIEMIAELTEYQIPFSKEIGLKESAPLLVENAREIQTFKGKAHVLSIVQNCIDRELFSAEAPTLKLLIPYECHDIYNYIFQQLLGCRKNLMLQDIVRLPKEGGEKEADQSLVALKDLLALSLLNNVEYESHYYYQSGSENADFGAVFPYFILTSESVITLSKDLKTAVLYENPALLKIYQQNFLAQLEKAETFIKESRDLFQIYGLEQALEVRHVLEPLPCFACYFTDEMIVNTLNPDFPYYHELCTAVVAFYKKFWAQNDKMINFFSANSLEKFMEDGRMYLPEELVNAFTREERLTLVKQLRDDLVNNRRKIFALNREKLFINSALEFSNEITVLRLVLHYNVEGQMVFKNIAINEPNTINAFEDFFDSLPESDFLLPPEAVIAQIDALIDAYEN